MTFLELSRRYIAAGHPDKRGERRPPEVCARELVRIDSLRKHLRGVTAERITVRNCAEYGAANRHRPRSADLDLQVLSNLCWFAVMEGVLQTNPVLGRAKHRKAGDVIHCRDAMPKDADELHEIAGRMMRNPVSAATGWQMLFEAFTGCRTSEVLAMRTDATQRGQHGFDDGTYLHVRRQKSGGFPYLKIDADLRELLTAHKAWKTVDSPWYFPGLSGGLPLTRFALSHRLKSMKLGKRITSHGLRAYFVTLHRSRGLGNEQVAALIGDRTSSLIETTYGALPEVWSGGEPLGFMPKNCKKAWET